MKRSEGARWSPAPGVRSTYTEGGAVLLDVKKSLCYSLNVVAAQIWVTIEGSPEGITLEGIVDALETHFHVARRQLEQDTVNWLDKLERLGLLHQQIGQLVSSS
jgi:hypothetical protein